MGWILVLIGAIGIGSSMLLQKRVIKKISVIEKIQEKRRYNLYLASDILLYVFEICTMFGIFLLATENPIHTTQYRIKEDSLLKIFIDFFVVYQITLLIILKLIDGHFINACQMMNQAITIAREIVQNKGSASYYLEVYKDREAEFTYAFPPEILIMFRDTMEDVEMYEQRYQNNDLSDISIDHYLYMLDSSKSLIDRLVEVKQDEWGVSILKRINKIIKLKMFRKTYPQRTRS